MSSLKEWGRSSCWFEAFSALECCRRRAGLPRRRRGRGYGVGRVRQVPGDAGRQAEARQPVIHSPRRFGGMVIYDRDRAGSIKRATTPPAVAGQTQNDPRPVTSEPVRRAQGVGVRGAIQRHVVRASTSLHRVPGHGRSQATAANRRRGPRHTGLPRSCEVPRDHNGRSGEAGQCQRRPKMDPSATVENGPPLVSWSC